MGTRCFTKRILAVRYTVFALAALGSSATGALFSCIHFAWVCFTNDTTVNATTSVNGTSDWSTADQQVIFSAYGIGSLACSPLIGWLINRYGCRFVYPGAMAAASVATILTPAAITAATSFVVVILQAIVGASSAFFPAAFHMCDRWAAEREQGVAIAIGTCGMQLGGFLGLLFAGVLCDTVGWKWIFWINGGIGLLFSVLWILHYRDRPCDHPLISAEELAIITKKKETRDASSKKEISKNIPWVAMLTNKSIVACLACRSINMFIVLAMAGFGPTFQRDILRIEPVLNGYLSASHKILALLGRIASGAISDIAIGSLGVRMRINACICFVGIGAFSLALALIKLGPENALLAASFIILIGAWSTFETGSTMKAAFCNAPAYSSIISGLMFACGSASGIVVPYVVVSIVSLGVEGWSYVFYLMLALAALGMAVYGTFVSEKLQTLRRPASIAATKDKDISVTRF